MHISYTYTYIAATRVCGNFKRDGMNNPHSVQILLNPLGRDSRPGVHYMSLICFAAMSL